MGTGLGKDSYGFLVASAGLLTFGTVKPGAGLAGVAAGLAAGAAGVVAGAAGGAGGRSLFNSVTTSSVIS